VEIAGFSTLAAETVIALFARHHVGFGWLAALVTELRL
jgi:hypothetical protein